MRDGVSVVETGTAESNAEVFHRHFPDGKLNVVGLSQLPPEVTKMFENYSRRFISDIEYRPGNFDAIHLITHGDGSITYAAKQKKEYRERGKTISEEDTYLVELNNRKIIGWGEIRKPLNGWTHNKPFVGFTNTVISHQRQGLGERRLKVMNALTQMNYRQPLNSDSALLPDSPAAKVWEKLASEGKAIKDTNGDVPKYSFKS